MSSTHETLSPVPPKRRRRWLALATIVIAIGAVLWFRSPGTGFAPDQSSVLVLRHPQHDAVSQPEVARPEGSQPEGSTASEASSEGPAQTPGISQAARDEIDLFAFATFQIQRVTVLQESRVQRELKLIASQIEKFTALNDEVKEMAANLQTLPPKERTKKLNSEYRPKAAEYGELVDAELSDEQEEQLLKRVLQRQRGAIIFLLPGVPQRLNLSPEQIANLYRMIETTRQSVDFDNLYSPVEIIKLVSKATAARKAAEAQLTPEQQTKWDALLAD